MNAEFSKARLAAQQHAASYLADCGFDGTTPDNYTDCYGGWDGWCIIGMGKLEFARSIMDGHVSSLLAIEGGSRTKEFADASREHHAEFFRIVEAAIVAAASPHRPAKAGHHSRR